MSHFTLELVTHGNKQYQIVPIGAHVHKYTEEFIYTDKIADTSIPIAYYESESLDAWKNIQIIDMTYAIPQNNIEFVANEQAWEEVEGTSYTSKFKNIAATNSTMVDSFGRVKPLFLKHLLPPNTVEATIHVLTGGEAIDVESGYKFDPEEDNPTVVYTNLQNYYNSDTGAYRLYYVVATDEDGTATHELLNPIPAAEEAEWDDIDLDTGTLTADYPLYTREKTASGYTFYFNIADTWYVKPTEASTIKPKLPTGKEPTDPWHIKFTNGDLSTLSGGTLRRYFIPEWDYQPFAPSKPHIFSPYGTMLWVNSNTVAATRNNLAIDPTRSMHFTLYVYDEDDILQKIYTTDSSLHGSAFPTSLGQTEVSYEANHILSWDNNGGFVTLDVEIDPNGTFAGSYFYDAVDYEYSGLTLNPLQNKDVLDYTWVFYIIPDVHDYDQAIHYLAVDRSGLIVYTSQEEGRSYPNLQLFNADGTTNPDSIIGMQYRSSTSTNTFVNNYTVPYFNEYAYYILSELVVMDVGIEEDSIILDVRRDGAVIREDMFEDAITVNQKILQSVLGYGVDGQEVPKNAVQVLRAPVGLREDFGGVLTYDESEIYLRKYTNAASHAVVDWQFLKPELTGHSLVTGLVNLFMTWEGPNLTYNIYRRESPQEEYELIHTIENPPRGTVEYTDGTDPEDLLESEKRYYYSLRIIQNEIEQPFGNMLSVMVE